jgi:hypothetical protein
MKSKLFRIFGVVTTVAVLVSMLSIAPAFAITQPTVSLSDYTISKTPVTYSIGFSLGTELGAGDTITITYPSDTIVGAAAATSSSIAASPGWVQLRQQ